MLFNKQQQESFVVVFSLKSGLFPASFENVLPGYLSTAIT
jgi:hypothetical protein